MRRLLLSGVVACLVLRSLRVSTTGASSTVPRVTAFYYPWYGTPARDGRGSTGRSTATRRPTTSPRRTTRCAAPTRRRDPTVLGSADGRDPRGRDRPDRRLLVGAGSAEDQRLPAVIAAAHADGLAVAAHLEPYPGRSVATRSCPTSPTSRTRDHDRLRLPRRSTSRSPTGCAAMPALHASRADALRADGASPGAAAAAGLRRGLHLRHRHLHRRQVRAHLRRGARHAPPLRRRRSAPATTRAVAAAISHFKPRGTARPTTTCGAPRSPRARTRVTITSYNEWHEGTQIEPAAPPRAATARYRYLSYDGAWGLPGSRPRTPISPGRSTGRRSSHALASRSRPAHRPRILGGDGSRRPSARHSLSCRTR